MGVPVDALSMDETVDKIIDHIERGELLQHMAINPAKVVRMMEDPEIRKTVRRCEVISADGIGFVWASRLLGNPLPERVTGIELMDRLLAQAAQRQLKPYFLGAKEEVVTTAVAHYEKKHPNLSFAGYRNGYFKLEEEQDIADAIRDSGADMLFVAISSPKKEQFLGAWRDRLQVPYCMGVGGSFDVIAGKVDRAPEWMQKRGLEWSYRWIQEPRRMFRRNMIDTPKFLVLALANHLTGLEVPQ